MTNSIYPGISRQVALQSQMDIVANNIANMSTPGYRAQNLVFSQYLAKAQTGGDAEGATDDKLAMVTDFGQFQSTAPGPIERTGNSLDVAIQGPGYFGVQTGQGVMYTRAGNFQLNARGEIVTGSGQPVASKGGSSIVIPQGAREVSISNDGTVSTDKGAVGQLMVVEFSDEQSLEAAGNGLYKIGADSKVTAEPAKTSTVQQGSLEGSNVQPVLEMTRMLEILRNYQNTQNMLQTESDRETEMIQHMTRTS